MISDLSPHDRADSRIVEAYVSSRTYMKIGRLLPEVQRAARADAAGYSKRQAWLGACAWDGIDPNSAFVTWSDDNPYAARDDQLVTTR